MYGNELWKVLIQHFISIGFSLNHRAWQGMELPSLVLALISIKT